MAQETIDTIKNELARRGKSRQWLAHEASISESSLGKAMAGQREFPRQTLFQIESVLEIDLTEFSGRVEVSSEQLGAYTVQATEWLVGEYVAVRAARKTPSALVTTALAIEWDASANCLVFHQSEYPGLAITLAGEVYLGARSAHIHLLARHSGECEMLKFARPDEDGRMLGWQLASSGGGGPNIPAAIPVLLVRKSKLTEFRDKDYGLIKPGEAHSDYLRQSLGKTGFDG